MPKPDQAQQRSQGKPRAVARWGLAALTLAYCVAAFGSAMDRTSERTLAAQASVPGPFRAFADIAQARLALNSQAADQGLDAAARAIRSRPIDAAGPSLLGTALALKGDLAGADAAFRVAAAGGWRDPMTQIYWANESIRSGDWDLAASRVDALMRAHPRLPGIDEFRAQLENDPRGLEALAQLIARHPPWLQSYLSVDTSMPADMLVQRGLVMERAGALSGPAGCELVRTLTATLLQLGKGAAADRVWRAHCPAATGLAKLGSGQTSGGFGQSDDPFGWQRVPGGEVRYTVEGDGRAVTVENLSPSAQLVASRPYAVDPGAVTLTWDARDADGDRSDKIDLSLDCGVPTRPPFGGATSRTVTAGECGVKTVGIWVASGSGPVTVRSIAAKPR
ncbi:hypothetical protein EKN06_06515 [Croceicoccus ponticola]|uniref:Tetratricopeptide repeat protein n=1 Tax=Croceicoccus ponticola TaxID=2217664 RepID=A0A437GY65_9SPHN|nr:hypothetical protein [Croceicoccus ponticola]RVQ67596.1 hypothetical protein EKN06_06515 [Croceicoccus ponticola]